MSNSAHRRGQLFVVSAPSGTGKTTVVEALVRSVPRLRMSRSYTSRPARLGEADEVDYNFVSRARFEAMIAGDQFLEWAEIFGNLYGTSRVDTDGWLDAGEDVVLVIDVQGARQIRDRGVPVVSVFVLPPSFEVLERRLRGRSKDSDAQVRHRLAVACSEVRAFSEYDYVVVNDDVDACVDRIRAVVIAERGRLESMRAAAEGIVRTFGTEQGDS